MVFMFCLPFLALSLSWFIQTYDSHSKKTVNLKSVKSCRSRPSGPNTKTGQERKKNVSSDQNGTGDSREKTLAGIGNTREEAHAWDPADQKVCKRVVRNWHGRDDRMFRSRNLSQLSNLVDHSLPFGQKGRSDSTLATRVLSGGHG